MKLKSKDQKIYFTSDYHLNHNQTFIYGKRGHASREAHMELMIQQWNNIINPEDVVFNLGDFMFDDPKGTLTERVLSELNGTHYLLWGNHNSGTRIVYEKQKALICSDSAVEVYPVRFKNTFFVGNYVELFIDGQPIILCHFPITVWNGAHIGTWMLHGHDHGTLETSSLSNYRAGKILDVGYDVFGYPVEYVTLKRIMDSKYVKSIDFHNESTSKGF